MEYQSLNIPLEQVQATRHHRRVAPLYMAIAGGVLLGVCAFRLPFAFSSTIALQPKDTFASIRIMKTADSVRAASKLPAAVGGLPWTLKDLLAVNNREMTVHVLHNGNMAVTFDKTIDETWKNTAQSYGYTTIIEGKSTLLLPDGQDAVSANAVGLLASILPGTDGELHVGGGSYRIKMHDDGIDILGAGVKSPPKTNFTLSEGARVTAQLRIPADTFSLPQALETLSGTPTGDILTSLFANGGTLAVSKDTQGIGFYLNLNPEDTTVESLAAMGKDLMNRQSLSTRSLTSNDGEEFTELVGDTDELDITIDAEDDYTFIRISNGRGETLRLARTPNLLTIANREISLESGSKARSSCLLSAHSWVTSEAISSVVSLSNVMPVGIESFVTEYFSEFAINSRKTRLCW